MAETACLRGYRSGYGCGQTGDDAGSLATSLKKQAEHQVDVIEGQIRDKPLLSLLAAFGVGLLLWHLFDRR